MSVSRQSHLRNWARRHILAITLAVAAAFTTVCALRMGWQPLSADENDFFLAMAYWPEWRKIIPHPHLYVHWAQLLLSIFGATVEAARLSVLIPHLLTLPLLAWLARLLYHNMPGRPNWQTIALVAIGLYALNPLIVQNSVLIDIDNGLLTTALIGLLCLWLALRRRSPVMRVFVLSIGFAICLWIKLPTPPMLAAALIAGELARRNWREAGIAATFTAGGAALFAVLHTVYGWFTGYTLIDAFAAFAWRAGNEGSILTQAPNHFIQTSGVMVFWLGLPIALLGLLTIWDSAQRWARRQIDDADIALLYVAGVFAFYGAMIVPAWGYPRYHTPALPVLMVIIAAWVSRQIRQPDRVLSRIALPIMLGGTLYMLFIVGDPMYDIYRATFETTVLAERLRIGGLAVARLALPMALVIGLGFTLAHRVRMTRTALLAGGLVALTLGSYLATDLVQVTAEYSTRYRYTYRYADRAQATAAVRANVPPGGYSLTDKDLLWYAGRPGDQIYPYLGNPDLLKTTLRARRVDVIAWAQKERLKATALNADAEALAILEQCYRSQQFGVFTVLTRTGLDPCLGIQ